MELKDLRTALFGFNKNDVCEYISQLNYIYEEKEAQKIKEQKDILKELNKKNEELNKKNEELNDYNSRLNQENTDLKRINDELQKKFELSDKRSSELENQIEEIRKATVSVLEEVKEQLNSAEKRISDLRTEQGYE